MLVVNHIEASAVLWDSAILLAPASLASEKSCQEELQNPVQDTPPYCRLRKVGIWGCLYYGIVQLAPTRQEADEGLGGLCT